MNLTVNTKNNLNTLLSIALNTRYTNVEILKCDMMDDTFTLSFERKISLNHLKKLNDYFGTDIRKKEIPYSLIVNKNSNTIKLHIEGIENLQMSLLNSNEDINDKVFIYDKKITKRLKELSNYLYETIYPVDTEIKEWTFYFIPDNKKYIGLANMDYQSDHCIKIYKSNFNWFKNESFPSFYNDADKLIGTINDAEIICLRRNYNSKYNSNWKPCIYGTPIHVLWPYDC